MKYGMVRAAALTPAIKVGQPDHNAKVIVDLLKTAAERRVEIAVLPELCITGYTCADLFFTRALLDGAISAVKKVADEMPKNIIAFVGAPVVSDGRLYNCAIGLIRGKVLGIVPKTELPDYGEFYEKRYFSPAFDGVLYCESLQAPMGNVLFECENYPALVVGCEICEDMWADIPPSVYACRAGATVIANLSASSEVVGKAEYRELLVKSASGRQHCAYIYADAGDGESSTDVVFSGHNIIVENGIVLDDSVPFDGGDAMADIDIERLETDRLKVERKHTQKLFERVRFALSESDNDQKPCRELCKFPFVPNDEEGCRLELILAMQIAGLKRRFVASRAKKLVVGVSGGLDSALALIVCSRVTAKENITAVTMPCFGTTNKTKSNARRLCAALGVELSEIDIKKTVESHLADIDCDNRGAAYENAQARTRTMTLFDIANKSNGLVVGTGDLSELALGWTTYNGDHMSAYGVNAGVPKTLVKRLIAYEAARMGGKAAEALFDILGTEITPELLPSDGDEISQKTEEILGKYDILDFVIYYHCRYGFTREKIEYLAGAAFYDVAAEQIKKALDTFYDRFFAAQFKRSCLPDGVKIGSVSLSPRSDFRLPSDLESKGK